VSLSKKVICTTVLAFLGLNNNLGLIWTLVQVLLPTNLVQLATSGSLLLLSKRVRPVGKIYTLMYMH
jgi:hypothetical protein